MKKIIIACLFAFVCIALEVSAQIPKNVLVQIVKAEDQRRYDKTLEDLIKSSSPLIRERAILAAGRIGDARAVPLLAEIVDDLNNPEVEAMAAFALGEIESIAAADKILGVLRDVKIFAPVKARAIEAAGKIAAANPKEAKSKELGEAILKLLEIEENSGKTASREVILLGLTAVLRARPEGGDLRAAKFLTNPDARVRADAANTLTRIRAKNANETLRAMLLSDFDPVARANAARALGAAEDKDALNLLLKAAVEDEDGRVRVSAMRSLASLRDKSAAERLLARGEVLLADFKKSKFPVPNEKGELLEIAAALGRILPNSADERAVAFLNEWREADKFSSPETEVALARVAPKIYVDSVSRDAEKLFGGDWRSGSAAFQGLGEIAGLESKSENDALKSRTRVLLVQLISSWISSDPKLKSTETAKLAVPDLLLAFAAFKSDNTSNIFRPLLEIESDPIVRATIVEILGEQPASKENVEALQKAFGKAYLADKIYNDAQLAILDALFKLDQKESVPTLLVALNSKDYLVRKRALELLRTPGLAKDSPALAAQLEIAVSKNKDRVLPYAPAFETKLGQILNTNADYLRAVSRRNGTVKAVLTTEKGAFTIDLTPEDAPLTVDNFIKMAKSGYFNGVAVHRVVPNFVMQDGDPRGDGNGGPGWSIRCEINLLEYERGAVGMALSGKDTGGSQWFVTHSPQPHLDGGYTIFGRVNESDMKIVDRIVRGDRILSVKIIEGNTPAKNTRRKPRA